MKSKFQILVVCFSLLLCGCGEHETDNGFEKVTPPSVESMETVPSFEVGAPPEEDQPSPLPEVLPVCETDFTETDSFPLPFEEELLTDKEGNYILSLDQALYDYDTMWLLLEENFPYLGAIERDLGIDWQAKKRACRTILRTTGYSGYVTLDEFRDLISKCLDHFMQVGHLYVIPPNMHQSLLDSVRDATDISGKNRYALLNNSKTTSTYAQYRDTERDISIPVHTETVYLTSTTQTAEQAAPIVAVEKEISPGILMGYVDEIPYLKCSTFSGWSEETYLAVEEFLLEIADAEHFILDVQGNGGGNDPAWSWGILPYLTDKTITSYMFVAGKSGSLNLWLDPEMDKSRERYEVYCDDSWQIEFPNIQPEIIEGVDIKLKKSYTVKGKSNQDRAPFQGKIWVLIDERSYSATDLLAFFCKDTGLATLVGKRSGGNGIGTAPYIMALPYSGLLIYYEPYISFNQDGTCNGTTGTAPDITVQGDQTALDVCLEAIKND